MAILDLLRRRREDEEDEEDDAGVTEDDEEEAEDDDSPTGLLGRFASVPGLGRVMGRRGEEEEDDGDDDEDAPEDEEEAGSGLMGRFNVMRGLGRVLRRGGDAEDEEDDDEEEAPPASAAIASQALPSQDTVARVRIYESAEEYLITGPGEQSPVEEPGSKSDSGDPLPGDEGEDESASGAEGSVEGLEEVTDKLSEPERRLRELASSQEDVPAEELAGELRELLNRINRRR